MSGNEIDAFIGAAVQEEVQLQIKLRDLDDHLARLADELIGFGSTMAKRTGNGIRNSSTLLIPKECERYGSLVDIANMVNSRIEIEKRLDEINVFLIRLKARMPDQGPPPTKTTNKS